MLEHKAIESELLQKPLYDRSGSFSKFHGEKNRVHALPKSEAHPDMNTVVPRIAKSNRIRMVILFMGFLVLWVTST